MSEVKMSDLDYDLFVLAHAAVQKANTVLMQFLTRAAMEAGVDPDTHAFNPTTRCFEPKPQGPTALAPTGT